MIGVGHKKGPGLSTLPRCVSDHLDWVLIGPHCLSRRS